MKIAIIGCGNIGIKLAGMFAMHGHNVKVHDTSPLVLDNILDRIEKDKLNLYEEGFIEQPSFPGQIFILSTIEEAATGCEYIFEAVAENLLLKQEILKRISDAAPIFSIIASLTLSLNLNDIFKYVNVPERTLGVRFLYPVYFIPEVEITTSRCTATAAIETVRSLLERMGKTLFFRSGKDPLILTEEQRSQRKQAHLLRIRNSGYRTPCEVQLQSQINLTLNEPSEMISSALNKLECAICMNEVRDTLLSPCHHLVSCYSCARILFCKHDKCPICRKQILDIVKVYFS